MNIIFSLALVVCLFDLSVASRLRENFNVLVPNNDVNLHAKIKTLLSDELDPEDFSDSEIERLNEIRDPDAVKLQQKSMKNDELDDDENNSNSLDNQLDHEVMVPSLKAAISDLVDSSKSNRISHSQQKDSHAHPMQNNPRKPRQDFMTTTPALPTHPSAHNTTREELTTPVNRTSESTSFTSTNASTTSWSTELTSSNMTSTTDWSTGNVTITTTTTPWPNQNTTTTNVTSTHPPTSTRNYTETTPQFPPTQGPEVTSSTTELPFFSDLLADECLLGTAEKYLPWLNKDGGLEVSYIRSEFGYPNYTDLSRAFSSPSGYNDYVFSDTFRPILSLRLLSASFNNLTRFPEELYAESLQTLEFLSLAGNNFVRIDGLHLNRLPELKALDLRRSRIESLTKHALENFPNLQSLFLADNNISHLTNNLFPSQLLHLDLSYNFNFHPEGLMMVDDSAVSNLNRLQRLDFSFTRLCESRCLSALRFLTNLEGLSLCSTDLNNDVVLSPLVKLKYLDISGNLRLQLRESLFTNISDSLHVLFARNSSRQDLDWTGQLDNLRILDLFNSNIHEVKSNSFSHMEFLTALNLEKNAIGNWYSKLFADNQHLETLNLRDNKLTLLTEDMKEDFMSVQFLAIGKNDFECNCVLQEFTNILFEATKAGNVSSYLKDKETDLYVADVDENNFLDTTRVSLGVRNYLRPEYDVISRTYQKYYKMAAQSVEAMKIRTSPELASKSMSRSLIMMSKVQERSEEGFKTILFDYDEDYDDYTCWNATGKHLQQIIGVANLCERETSDQGQQPYEKQNKLTALWISLPTVIIVSGLLLVVWWKWWYIKYFFVLCKNSAILTFMDDSDDDKETIIRKNSTASVEVFLYDAFVSYCEQNREWVLDEFIPNIERRESINVCLHERDFQVGYGILENIVSCMDRSRCLLLLISENFLLSQWCQFEMNLAQHRLLETRREKLILVLLEDIPTRKQPKTLKYLMRTKTYIKWPQSGTADEKALFWKRLKKAIISSKWERDSYGSIV